MWSGLLLPLLVPSALATSPLRVATWNIERVGMPGSWEYDTTVEILRRLDADVLVLNEVAGSAEATYVPTLAADAGFEFAWGHQVRPLSGYQRNAILSRLPLHDTHAYVPSELSGDPNASDLSRPILHATVTTPEGEQVVIVGLHWKSGVNNRNEFRRAVTSLRLIQSLEGLDPDRDAVVVMGDMNAELGVTQVPAMFSSPPSGLPTRYQVGQDILAMDVVNTAFDPLLQWGLVPADLRQRDGSDATRPASGRRLDYIWTSQDIEAELVEGLVFSCEQDLLTSPIPLVGTPTTQDMCEEASDHFPVVADIVVGGTPTPVAPTVREPIVGDLVITELAADPSQCRDNYGEWFELENLSSDRIDLQDVVIADASGRTGMLDRALIVEPGARVILGRSTPSRWCGQASPDAWYGSSVSLNNSGDRLDLRLRGTLLERTATYTQAMVVPDTTIHVAQLAERPADNDLAADWCISAPSPGAAAACL